VGEFDAFISYSHAADGKLAPALQSGLQRLAKGLFQRRALRVFRDETGLSTNPHLWSAIEDALMSSDWFILLASPESARSEWVNREVTTWHEHKSVDHLLIVVTDGEIAFEDGHGVDRAVTDCLPAPLVDALAEEPRWLDMRWARNDDQLDLRNGRFRAAVADLAAPIHGIPKDELEGEDVRQQRRVRRSVIVGVAAISLLAVAALAASVIALSQRDRADAEANRAISRSLSSQATALRGIDADTSLLLAAEGFRRDPSIDTDSGLLQALDGARFFTDLVPDLPDRISDLATTADRRVLYVLSSDGDVTAHDSTTLELLGDPIRTGIGTPNYVDRSATGSKLAFGGATGVEVVDLESGQTLIDGAGGPNAIAALSPDGSRLAVSMISEPTVQVIDVESGETIATIDAEYAAAVFLADGRLAVAETGSPVLTIYELTGNGAVKDLEQDTGVSGAGVTLSPDGSALAFGGLDGSILLLDTETFEPLFPAVRIRGSRVSDVAFSPDGALIALSSDDGSVTVVDTTNGREVETMIGMTGSLTTEFVSNDSLVSASFTDGGSSEWSLGGTSIGTPQQSPSTGVVDLRTLDQGRSVAYLTDDGETRIAPIGDIADPTIAHDFGDYGRAIDVSESAGLVASYVLEVDEAAQAVTARTIEIARLDDLTVITDIDVGDRSVNAMSFDPSGRLLAVGSDSGELTVYDTTDGSVIHGPVVVDEFPAALGLLVWSPDGARLHTGGQDGKLRTFDSATWSQLGEVALNDNQTALRRGTLSPDARFLVAPSESGDVFLVDEASGDVVGAPFIAAGTQLQSALLVDDGRTLAAVSRDGTVRLWDVDTRRSIGPALAGHTGFSQALAQAGPGHLLTGGAEDGRIIDWNLDPTTWFDRACELAGRNLTQQEWTDQVGGRYQTTCPDHPPGT
jgi:WD40 repeat protein